jgi:hypothetical protein
VRRRIFGGACSALLFAVLLPSTVVAAADYSTATLANACNASNYPSLKLTFKAKITAKGTTSTNWLRIQSRRQHRDYGSSTWVTDHNWPDKNLYYTANGSAHSLSLSRSFTFDDTQSFDYMRIVFTMSALDSNYGGLTNFNKVVKSVTCGGQ